MTIRSKLLLLIVVVSCNLAALPQCPVTTEGKQPALSLALQAAKGTVKSGDPVEVRAVLTNNSKQDVIIARTVGYPYGIDVWDERKNLAPDTELGRYKNGHVDFTKVPVEEINPHLLTGSIVCITLKTGMSWRDTVNISRLYNMEVPGKYTIQIRVGDPVVRKDVKSNVVTVVVTP